MNPFIAQRIKFSTKRNAPPSKIRNSCFQQRCIHHSIYRAPDVTNEPIMVGYHEGGENLKGLKETIQKLKSQKLEIPLIINGKEIKTEDLGEIRSPHDHKLLLGTFHRAGSGEVVAAINAALAAKRYWGRLDFYSRASIMLKIAELAAGPYRNLLNAATILGQSKTLHQSEVDIAELVDFARFNVKYLEWIMSNQQPPSDRGSWNRIIYRPLEGFVAAISPFNFTAIGSNLCLAPALCGNTVVWKPSDYSMLSNYYLMQIYKEAGLPPGVINFIPGPAAEIANLLVHHPEFAGLHFTGSTQVFQQLWQTVGKSISLYNEYPRLVGETGGKNFVVAHPSADEKALACALLRGAFEYAGQKCSAASRVFVPKAMWDDYLEDLLLVWMPQVKVGNPENKETFVNAVISRDSFNKVKSYIDYAKEHADEYEIVYGGTYDDSVGYFVHPTIILSKTPNGKLMTEEIFGPVLTIYLYEDIEDWETVLDTINESNFALTGSIFAKDPAAMQQAAERLTHAAGNLYFNDKPTGASVNQQPFGGARKSGTNDKAGSYLNLLRWLSPQTIKTTHVPPTDVLYPYMKS